MTDIQLADGFISTPVPYHPLPVLPKPTGKPPATSEICSLALVLLMDESGSMYQDGWRKELNGTADAFDNPEVVAQIRSAVETNGPVAVRAIGFDTDGHELIPWRLLRNEADIHRYAQELRKARDGTMGATSINVALDTAMGELEQAPCSTASQKIDIATDDNIDVGTGVAPDAAAQQAARDRAEAKGIQINGLSIGDERSAAALQANAVTRQPLGHLFNAQDMGAFPDAMLSKLMMEVSERLTPAALPKMPTAQLAALVH